MIKMKALTCVLNALLAAACAEEIFYYEPRRIELDELPFHVYNVCQPLVDAFATASLAFSHCSLKEAIPPQVCVGCGDKYAELLNAYDTIIHNVRGCVSARKRE